MEDGRGNDWLYVERLKAGLQKKNGKEGRAPEKHVPAVNWRKHVKKEEGKAVVKIREIGLPSQAVKKKRPVRKGVT